MSIETEILKTLIDIEALEGLQVKQLKAISITLTSKCQEIIDRTVASINKTTYNPPEYPTKDPTQGLEHIPLAFEYIASNNGTKEYTPSELTAAVEDAFKQLGIPFPWADNDNKASCLGQYIRFNRPLIEDVVDFQTVGQNNGSRRHIVRQYPEVEPQPAYTKAYTDK